MYSRAWEHNKENKTPSRLLSRNEREPSFGERFQQCKQYVLPEGEHACVSNLLGLTVSVRKTKNQRKDIDKITYCRLPWQLDVLHGCSSLCPKILDGILNDEHVQDGGLHVSPGNGFRRPCAR